MGEIRVLEKAVAEKIAAGEVVERPASIVKELIENSLDAGASFVTVEINSGGISYIRVTDNGKGISADDAPLAFLRHATSKINDEKDLERIMTLGFRGEALASIAAVSEVEILSKRRNETSGIRIKAVGGVVSPPVEAGCPEGTTVVVRNLFYNTPARMKFLKKDSTEAGYIADICQKQALCRPDISIRLIKDGKEQLFTPGDNDLRNAAHSVLGRDFAREMIEVAFSRGGLEVSGLTGKNSLSRPNRNMQIFFVNGRWVSNRILGAALGEAYKNELMTGRFPVAVLTLKIDPRLIDVNVHPAKIEIKFSDEGAVYDAVYWAVRNALKSAAGQQTPPPPKLPFEMPVRRAEVVQPVIVQPRKSAFAPYTPPPPPPERPRAVFEQKTAAAEPAPPYAAQKQPEITIAPPETESAPVRVIGQVFLTYILAQRGDEFLMIDQHAAHERIKYEQIRQNGAPAQRLLSPITVTVSAKEKDTIIENADFFHKVGFECEDFGRNSIVLRSVPADIDFADAGDLLLETVARLERGEGGEAGARRDNAVYTIACKAAVKANKLLPQKEMERLCYDALSLDGITTCPHGRPISVKFTKQQVEKMFKRIV